MISPLRITAGYQTINGESVNTACNAGGAHRFSIQLGASYPPGTRIFIYGIAPGGASLVNSGSVYIP